METNPYALLAASASDDAVSIDKLARAALLVAQAAGDADASSWLKNELDGYEGTTPPEYRFIPAQPKVKDRWGRAVPLVIRDPSPDNVRSLHSCPLVHSLSELNQMTGNQYQVLFPPEYTAHLLTEVPGITDAFLVIQGASIKAALMVVQQKIFSWAANRLHVSVKLPPGVSIERMLGTQIAPPKSVLEPIEATSTSLNLSGANIGNMTLAMSSPGAVQRTMQSNGSDSQGLKELATSLASLSIEARNRGESEPRLAKLEEAISDLRALVDQPDAKTSWVRGTLHSVKAVLENAAGSVLGELAKPYALPLVAQLLQRFSG